MRLTVVTTIQKRQGPSLCEQVFSHRQVDRAVKGDKLGEKNRHIAGALKTKTGRKWMFFNDIYRQVFGLLIIHTYASLTTVPQMTKNPVALYL
jgi:hypothetical protein